MPKTDPRFSRYQEVLVYSRWSSKAQTTGQSRSRQQDLATDWATRHGVTLSNRKLVDAGASGFHGKNLEAGGALGQLLEEVKAGKVPSPSLLLVEAADRFGRRPPVETVQRLFSECLERGLDIYLMDRNMLVTKEAVNTDVSVLIRLALEIDAAHKFSASLSKRMLQAHEQGRKAQAEGKIVRAGWRPEWIDLVDAKGNVIPRTAPREQVKTGVKWQLNQSAAIVERVVSMAEQGHGQIVIARTLNAEGIPPLRAERTKAAAITKAKEKARQRKQKFDPATVPQPLWNPGQVEHLLTSVAVAGGRELRRRSGEITWDYYPAVIPRARWEALQARLRGRSPGAGAGRQDQCRYIGQAVTVCHGCGAPWGFRSTMHSRNGQRFSVGYIRCRGVVRGACDQPSLRIEQVTAHLLTRLSGDQLAQLFPEKDANGGRAMRLQQIAALRQEHREAAAMAQAAEAEVAKALATEPALAAVMGRQQVAAEQRAAELEQKLLMAEHQLQQLDSERDQQEVAQLNLQAGELLQLFAKKEDTVEMRQAVNALLRRLDVRVQVDGHGERIGMAVADAPLQWQPLAAAGRIRALQEGMVDPALALGDTGQKPLVLSSDGKRLIWDSEPPTDPELKKHYDAGFQQALKDLGRSY